MAARVIPFPRPRATVWSAVPDTPPRRPPRTRRRVLTGVAVVTAAAVITALVLHHGRNSSTGGGATRSSTRHGAAPASGQVVWTLTQGVYLPSSPTAGPLRRDGELRTGFADSDLGAALAAVHIVYQASPDPGPAVFTSALDQQVTGSARDALAASVRADYEQSRVASGLPAGSPLGAGVATFTGYRVTALPAGGRQVEVTETAPDTNGVAQVFAIDVALTRSGGDWKVVAPAGGSWNAAITELSDAPEGITRFTPASPGAASTTGGKG